MTTPAKRTPMKAVKMKLPSKRWAIVRHDGRVGVFHDEANREEARAWCKDRTIPTCLIRVEVRELPPAARQRRGKA